MMMNVPVTLMTGGEECISFSGCAPVWKYVHVELN